MQDNSFPAAEKILSDIFNIIKKNSNLYQFDIIPQRNDSNRSPVVHIENCLGLESWCVKHVYDFVYQRLISMRMNKTSRREDPEVLEKLLTGALLLNPYVSTFWNMRRELISFTGINIELEMRFTFVVLSYKPKSLEAFNHRKWIFLRANNENHIQTSFKRCYFEKEMNVISKICEKQPNNYHALNYRTFLMTFYLHNLTDCGMLLSHQWHHSEKWIFTHISDHSGLTYRQFILRSILETPHTLQEFRGEAEKAILPLVFPVHNFALSYFVIRIGIMLYELQLSNQMLPIFPGHEALWCHRRFIFHMFNCLLRFYIRNKGPTTKRQDFNSWDIHWQSHNNKNPPPQQLDTKDIHFNDVNSEQNLFIQRIFKKIAMLEKTAINNLSNSPDIEQIRLVMQHRKWLKTYIGMNLDI